MTLVPYKTLRKRGHDEFIVNKSRFIADSAPVSTEEDALAFLAHWSASAPTERPAMPVRRNTAARGLRTQLPA